MHKMEVLIIGRDIARLHTIRDTRLPCFGCQNTSYQTRNEPDDGGKRGGVARFFPGGGCTTTATTGSRAAFAGFHPPLRPPDREVLRGVLAFVMVGQPSQGVWGQT